MTNFQKSRFPRALLLFSIVVACICPQAGGQTSRRRHPHHVSAVTTTPSPPPKFKLNCTLPELTKDALAIDKSCGINGNSKVGSKSAKQNVIKNRFCLPGSPTAPMEIDFKTFDDLQDAARAKKIPFGRKKDPTDPKHKRTIEDLPPNRSLLVDIITVNGRKLGEGSLVTLEGFVFKARHSNVGSGESVNCNVPTLAGNDIHIALARTKKGTEDKTEASECETVTAEITPHHRSALYNRFDTLPADFLNGKKQQKGKDKLEGKPLPLVGTRVRVTGQLFFDGSHSPCRNGKGGPPRRSIWEIHPVFEITVFEASQNKFISFEKWEQLHGN